MGLLDITTNVVTSYKADTSDAKAKIKELQGEERELAKAQLDQANARNDQLEDWVKKLGQVGVALAAVKAAADFVWDAYKLKQQETRLEIAATGIDVERLSEAFGGLKTHMEVLEFAQRANHSAFQLTQEELEKVARAVTYFTEQGFESKQVQEDFTNALVTGRTRGLAPYGFQVQGLGETVDMAGDKLSGFQKKTENVNDVMGWIEKSTKGAGEGLGAFGEEGDRAAVTLKDSWEQVKLQFADIGEELVPLVKSLADVVGYIGQIIALAKQIPGGGNGLLGTLNQMQDDEEGGGDWMSSALRGGTFGLFGGGGNSGNFSVGKQLMTDVETAKRSAEIVATRGAEQFKAEEKEFFKNFGDQFKPLGGHLEDASKYIAHASEEAGKEAARQAAEQWKTQHEKMLALMTKIVKNDGDELVAKLEADIANAKAGAFGDEFHKNYDRSDITGPLAAARALGAGPIEHENTHVTDAADALEMTRTQAFTMASRFGGVIGDREAGDKGDGLYAPQLEGLVKLDDALKTISTHYHEVVSLQHEGFLTKLFGPVEQFEVYKDALKGIGDAFAQGMTAMVTGSDSFGHAFKKALGGMLHGLAMKEYAMGATEELEALADLIMLDPAAAGMHAARGALYIGAGVGLDLVASELGYSAGGNSAKSAFSGGGATSGASSNGFTGPGANRQVPTGHHSSGPGQQIVIVYGDTFYDTPYQREAKAKQIVDTALGGQGGRDG